MFRVGRNGKLVGNNKRSSQFTPVEQLRRKIYYQQYGKYPKSRTRRVPVAPIVMPVVPIVPVAADNTGITFDVDLHIDEFD